MAVRKKLTAEKLIKLHTQDNLSLAEIGKMYGVSRQRIHQLKKEFEEKYGKINRRLFIDVVTLKHYLDQGWTAKQIAERFEMKASKVSRLIRKYRSQYENGVSEIKIKRKTVDELINKYELKMLYEEKLMTDKEIAKHFQVSASTVGMLRRKYKIKTMKTKALRKLPQMLTHSKFERLYLQEGYTLQEIASKFDCNVAAVIELKEQYGIKK